MMKALLPKILILALVAGLLGTGAWWVMRDGKAVQYQTAALEKGHIQATISATGNCNAVVTVQVGSQVSGNIKALFADFNTKVKKDQLVAQIDPAIFQAKVDQARAKLESDQAAVINAQANVEKVEADVASAKAGQANQEANAVRARVAVTDAKSKLDHDIELFGRGIVSLEERDTAQATYDSAVAALTAAQAQVEAARHQISAAEAQRAVAKTQLTAAQAQARQSQASLTQAEIDLKHTEIKAPVDGTVVARKMDVGQTVAASFQAPTIFEIAQDLTKMQVDTNVDEADVGQVRVGQNATFTVDAYPGDLFEGKVVQIRQAANVVQNVVTYDVVVEVPNDNLKLFPGMTANVQILVNQRDDVLKLPNAALRVRLMDDAARTKGAGQGTGVGTGGGRPGVIPGRDGAGGSGGGAGKKGFGRRGDGTGRPGGSGRPGGAERTGTGGEITKAPAQEASVYLLDPKNKPRPVKVTLGISDGNYTAIEGGEVKEGDPVIVGVVTPRPASGGSPFGGGGMGGGMGGPGGGRRGMGF